MPAKNVHQNGSTTTNGTPTPFMPNLKESIIHNVPESGPALPTRIFRVALLLSYFWTSSIM